MSCDVMRARILVVDDDPGMLRAIHRVLRRPHDVTCAPGPEAALELAGSLELDLAVLDIRMPGMDGFELMGRLNAEHPDLDVILMTGDVNELDATLIRAIQQGAFYFIQKPFNNEVLQTLVERCLELRRLRQERGHQIRRLERELAEARQFQLSLLPPAQNHLEGVSISARYIASAELGGDFYDYAAAGDGRVALLIADVSGHGASAAMMTGIVKSAFHAAHADAFEPLAVLDRVSVSIRAFDAARFVTLTCVRINSAPKPSLDYANAGHPPAIVAGPGGGLRFLEPTGPLVSSGFPDLTWEQHAVTLDRDDRLLLYTDGITEARTEQGEFFGRDRIVSQMAPGRDAAATLLDDILGAVAEFSGRKTQSDDMTLLAADFREGS